MGIGFYIDAHALVCGVFALRLSNRNKEALGCGISIDLVVDALALLGERGDQRLPCDANSAVVGGILAESQPAVEVDAGYGLKAVVLIDFAIEALLEGGAIGVGPPGIDVAMAIVLATLVIEAVRHLVADAHTDCAEVDRGILSEIVEGRLQDAGGKLMSFTVGL